MALHRTSVVAASVLIALAAGGYWYYSNAVQGEGVLAQAPMNVQNKVKPAFIMAVDDSNSMTFERIFPGGDGHLQWNGQTNSFFRPDGTLAVGGGCNQNSVDCFLYLFPHNGFRDAYEVGDAIPPLDSLGFARSPDINRGYFNPGVTYKPWTTFDGQLEANASITATRADPRSWNDRPYNVTYNLTADRSNTGEYFSVTEGMVLPRGTVYQTNSNCGNLPNTRGAWSQPLTADIRLNVAACGVSFRYFPAVFYLTNAQGGATLPADYGYTATPIEIRNGAGPGKSLYKYEIKPGNFSSGRYQPAIQNFANWFQYRRSRLLAMVGAMTDAMDGIKDLRVGFVTINQAKFNPPAEGVQMRETSASTPEQIADRKALYESMTRLNHSGGTPNRTAVEYIARQFRRTGANAPILKACQKNGGMLFTDGLTNSSDKVGTNYGNLDGTQNAVAPFSDGFNNTIADVVTYYYSGLGTPLRVDGEFNNARGGVPIPEEACNAKDPRADCVKDLHMNFYAITLGQRGNIYDVNAAATLDPFKTHPNWNGFDDPTRSDNGAAVDELWHATINTRGEFINAKSPSDISDAMKRVLSSVGGGNSPSGTIGLTGARIGDNTLSITPEYTSANNGTDWFGYLNAQKIEFNPVTGKITTIPRWEAAAKLNGTAAARNITFGVSNGSVNPTVQPFTATALGSDDDTYNLLCSDSLATCKDVAKDKQIRVRLKGATAGQMIDYLRGDRALEINGTTGYFRKRTTLLGDIVNSAPLVSAWGDDYGYRNLRVSGKFDSLKYGDYLTQKRNTKNTMVYVGANDGMLHAFDGETGAERFAYIPVTSLGHMGNLLFPYDAAYKSQVFDHRYYVDGAVTVSDIHTGSVWKTALLGAAGAGGRGVFALDVTNPSGNPPVLWDINDKVTANDANGQPIGKNIGYVLSRPVIVPVDNAGTARWKAIFGNGYNSDNGKAVLFVVDMIDGTVNTITATDATLPTDKRSGLGNLVAIDRWEGSGTGANAKLGRDGLADTVYAADQNGNVWKFDLRDNSVGFNGTPLFTAKDGAGNRQPITGGLQVTSAGGGAMIYFGTGSFSFENDPEDKSMQTMYGVLDDNSGTPVGGRDQLQKQRIIAETREGYRSATNTDINSSKKGWYIDLGIAPQDASTPVAAGERFVGYSRLQNGILFFTTYTPTAESSTSISCGTDGNNIEYGLNALSGGAQLGDVSVGSATGNKLPQGTAGLRLDTQGTGVVTDIGVLTTGRSKPLGAGATPEQLAQALATQCSVVLQPPGAEPQFLPRPCGRQSWRQIR